EDASPPAAKPATAEIFSLDLDDAPAAPPPPAPKPAPARSPAVSISPPTGEFFSLDADEPPAPSMASPSATVAPAPASEVSTAAFVAPSAKPSAKPAKPAPAPAPAPAAPPAAEGPITTLKPAKNGRPAIRITIVRPGEKSPLGG